MSRHDDRVRLKDMLEHACEAVELCQACDRAVFDQDRMRQLALTRLIEIVGEAASQVSVETRRQHDEIPWAPIIGMRNHIVHAYGKVNLARVWNTVMDDLPPLIDALKRVLESTENRS